uniref:Lipoprotein n=1 Tax=Strongyloides papillosus TaxID=174720 RepID=A0A0N5BE15_STREA
MEEKLKDREYGQMISKLSNYIGRGISETKLIVTLSCNSCSRFLCNQNLGNFPLISYFQSFQKLKMNFNIYFFAVIAVLSLSVFGAKSCDNNPQKKGAKTTFKETRASHPGGNTNQGNRNGT